MGSDNISVSSAQMSARLEPAPAGQTGHPVISQFKGERVALLPTAEAILADSLEELTFGFSEVSNKKEISERNLRSGIKSFAMEQAEKYLEKVPDLDQDGALKKWVEDVGQMPKSSTEAALLQHVQERFKDPSHAFLALSLATDMAEHEEPGSEFAANVGKAKALYYEQHGEAIEAGINISVAVSKAEHGRVGDAQLLRDTYREVVLDYSSISAAYEQIIAKFPDKPLSQALAFMVASLSADIHASQRDSTRSIKLQGIVNDLSQVKQLNTLYSSCTDLLQRCHRLYASRPAGEKGAVERMLAFIIELKDAEWQGGRVIDKVLDYTGLMQPEASIYFLQGLKNISRLIPLKVFNDNNQRERMLESIQQRIDLEIDHEAELE